MEEYAILSSKYLKGASVKNWHLFKIKQKTVNSDDKINITVKNKFECNEIINNFSIDVMPMPFFYYMLNDNGVINDVYVDGSYYTDKDNTVYYSDNEDIIRVLSAFLGRGVCGTCVSALYKDNNTIN